MTTDPGSAPGSVITIRNEAAPDLEFRFVPHGQAKTALVVVRQKDSPEEQAITTFVVDAVTDSRDVLTKAVDDCRLFALGYAAVESRKTG